MSIIYEALKKVEGQKDSPLFEDISVAPSPSIQKKGKKAALGKKIFILSLTLFLIALGAFLLYTSLTKQEEERKIDPARVYNTQKPKKQISGGIVLKKEPVREYILEGIVYDGDASFAIINGKVIKETDTLGSFRMDKISEDNVEMINSTDNNKVTLSLP